MTATTPIKPIDKKAQAFITDLNKLCNKYLYQIKLTLSYEESKISPSMTLVNIPPKKTSKSKAPKKKGSK